MSLPFPIGSRVMTGVFVMNQWHPMHPGIVVADHNGYCDVDVMSLHGGAPWIHSLPYNYLRADTPLQSGGSNG